MTWACPYLEPDGACRLRNKGCDPLAKGCVIPQNDRYKRIFQGDKKPNEIEKKKGKNSSE